MTSRSGLASWSFFAFRNRLVRPCLDSLLLLFLPILGKRRTKDVLSAHNAQPSMPKGISDVRQMTENEPLFRDTHSKSSPANSRVSPV